MIWSFPTSPSRTAPPPTPSSQSHLTDLVLSDGGVDLVDAFVIGRDCRKQSHLGDLVLSDDQFKLPHHKAKGSQSHLAELVLSDPAEQVLHDADLSVAIPPD